MKKVLPLIHLLFCSLFAFSQGIYKSGLVVKNAGDTLKGWIKDGDWEHNPSKIEFKSDSNSHSFARYTVGDIQYFEITGRDAYKSATVTLDMRSVNPTEISSETKDINRTGTLFLKVLVRGKKLSLYEFVDFKHHYFLQADKDTVEELLFKLSMDANDNIVSEWNRYKEQLQEYAVGKKSPSLDREIEDARYSAGKLAKIVMELNGNESVSIYEKTKDKPVSRLHFFISAGASLSQLATSGNVNVFPEVGMKYKSSLDPTFSTGIDLSSAKNFSEFTVRLEVAFSQGEYKGDKHSSDDILGFPEYETYTIKQQNISPSISAMYNFRRARKVRYYAGLGVAFNISSYSMSRYTQVFYISPPQESSQEDPIKPANEWTSLFWRAGVHLGRKFEIGATGNIYGSFTNHDAFSASPRTCSLKLAYFFF